MLRNAANIVAVELLSAGAMTGDRFLSPEIERVAALVRAGCFTSLVAELFPTTSA
jgi:hypothetical protein